MIIVKLWGGLGNQMFQYAFGYHLSKKTREQLVLDISWFSTQNLRKPEILEMNIEYDHISEIWKDSIQISYANSKIINILLRIPVFKIYHIGGFNYLKESRYRYIPQIEKYSLGNSYLDGYWQCSKYFDDIRSDLVRMYKPKNLRDEVEKLSQRLRIENSCAIHVRRGDYRKKRRVYSRLQAIGDTYYSDALKKPIENRCSFYLFSNGKDEAIQLIKSITGSTPKRVTDELDLDTIEEWYLMKSCKNQVIGNSTFSWWAAYLNDNETKIVCAPNKYMGNDDIIPSDWLKYKVE